MKLFLVFHKITHKSPSELDGIWLSRDRAWEWAHTKMTETSIHHFVEEHEIVDIKSSLESLLKENFDDDTYLLGFNDGFDSGREFPKRKQQKAPVAYEWHNFDTGHSYVDYIPRPNKDEKDGYKKHPLYR
jgi:hypothetical protein